MNFGGGYSSTSGGGGGGFNSGYGSGSSGGYNGGYNSGGASSYGSWAMYGNNSTGGMGDNNSFNRASGGNNGSGGGRDLASTLQAMAYSGGGISSGGGFGSRGSFGSGMGSGRKPMSGGFDMSKYAGYQTNKRKMEDHRGRSQHSGSGPREKRPKREPLKPRQGREPELNIYIDNKFNYWNLPSKAKVLLISNIPQVICQPLLLYNLFSFYGDVDRIKILRKRNNCALIEFTTATFACIARDHLDQVTIKGDTIVVTFSRFDRVRLPHEIGLQNDGNTQDFSGPEHQKLKRYWNEELKKNNMRKIISPTSTLHVSGIQAGKSPNDVKRLFESFGLSVIECLGVEVKNKKKTNEEEVAPGTASSKPRMFCYVQFASIEDGIIALSQFGNSAAMRISFAKDNLATLKRNCIEKKLPLVVGEQVVTE